MPPADPSPTDADLHADFAAELESFGFRAERFQARFLAEDGSTGMEPVAGFTCDGLGVHRDGNYWRICALGSGQPLGLMPTVSATRRLCTRILQIEGYDPAGPALPGPEVMQQIRALQADIVADEAEALRRRAEELADEIAYLEEKAAGFAARALLGAASEPEEPQEDGAGDEPERP